MTSLTFYENINQKSLTREEINVVYQRLNKNKGKKSYYENLKQGELVKIHFDIDYLDGDEYEDCEEIIEEAIELLDAIFDNDVSFSYCFDDKKYKSMKKKDKKTEHHKLSIHLVGDKTIQKEKLKFIIDTMIKDQNKNDWEFDADIYKGDRKFRLPLTNKDSCLENRTNKGYMRMGGVGLKYFKKLCITYTDGVEELKNEALETLYEEHLNKSKKTERVNSVIDPATIEMVAGDKDLIRLMIKGFEPDFFNTCDLWKKFVFILKNEGFETNEIFELYNKNLSTENRYESQKDYDELDTMLNDSALDGERLTIGTLIYELKQHNPEYYNKYCKVDSLISEVVDAKLLEFKQKNPKQDTNTFNINFFNYLTSNGDYLLKREYWSRYIIYLMFENKHLYKTYNYCSKRSEWEVRENNKIGAFKFLYFTKLVEITDNNEGEKKYRDCKTINKGGKSYFVVEDKFITSIDNDRELVRYNKVIFNPVGIDEERLIMNDYNTFDEFGFVNHQNKYKKMFGEMLLKIECDWKTRTEWSNNKPKTDMDNMIRSLNPVGMFVRDLINCNLDNKIMYEFKQLLNNSKTNTIKIDKKELYGLFKSNLEDENTITKSYSFLTFDKQLNNLLFGNIGKGVKHYEIDLKKCVDKLTKLNIVEERKFKDFETDINLYEYSKYTYQKKEIGNIIKNEKRNEKKEMREHIKKYEVYVNELMEKMTDYNKEEIDNLRLFLEYMFYNICSNRVDIFDYVLKWIRFIITHPKLKNGKCLLCYSREMKTGKGEFGKFLRGIIGMNFSLMGNIEKMFNQFGNSSDTSILSIYDEIGSDSFNNKNYNMFKNVLTETDALIEKKYDNVRKGNDFNKIILLTNEINSIRVDSSEDRFLILGFTKLYGNDFDKFKDVLDLFYQ